MKTYTITKEDLNEQNEYIGPLDLTNLDGNLEADPNLGTIKVKGLNVTGYILFKYGTGIDAGGDIASGNDINSGGNIYSRGDIYARSYINANGDIATEGSIKAGGDIKAGLSITCGKHLRGGRIWKNPDADKENSEYEIITVREKVQTC